MYDCNGAMHCVVRIFTFCHFDRREDYFLERSEKISYASQTKYGDISRATKYFLAKFFVSKTGQCEPVKRRTGQNIISELIAFIRFLPTLEMTEGVDEITKL